LGPGGSRGKKKKKQTFTVRKREKDEREVKKKEGVVLCLGRRIWEMKGKQRDRERRLRGTSLRFCVVPKRILCHAHHYWQDPKGSMAYRIGTQVAVIAPSSS